MRAIMLMYDTLTRNYLPNYGCDFTIMPNFERLGTKSVTYDEFYALYLKPWDNEENKPSNDILNATNYHANSHASPSPASTSPSETTKGE